jgi:hypothetical protein
MERKSRQSSVEARVETQRFLDKAYFLVASSLQEYMHQFTQSTDEELKKLRDLAREADIPISDTHVLATEREKILTKIVWLPVAQECVVTLLRAILEKSRGGHGKIEIHPENLRDITNEIVSHANFSLSLGLSPEDAKVALLRAKDTIFERDLFAQPIKLAVDDNTYLVHREDDHLVVEPAA